MRHVQPRNATSRGILLCGARSDAKPVDSLRRQLRSYHVPPRLVDRKTSVGEVPARLL